MQNTAGGGATGAIQVWDNPVERGLYHTDWVADRTLAWLAAQPDDADAWGHRGVALAGLGRMPEALQAFEQALKMPRHARNAARFEQFAGVADIAA
jgi:tetratricopeptide (TPR) repeat protein